MPRFVHSSLLFLFIGLLAAQPTSAYEYPLSSGAVRDAYFLGKASAAKREAFFARYTRHLPLPRSGPYISLIRVETPFAFVVERTERSIPQLLAPDAQQAFYGKPMALRVHVRIDLTPSYGWQIPSPSGGVRLRSPDFWRKFSVELIQGRPIRPVARFGRPDYSFATKGSSSVLTGADIELEYNPQDVRSAPATVVVTAPDGRQVAATFDLRNLR